MRQLKGMLPLPLRGLDRLGELSAEPLDAPDTSIVIRRVTRSQSAHNPAEQTQETGGVTPAPYAEAPAPAVSSKTNADRSSQ